MDLMNLRRGMLNDSVMQGNKFYPDTITTISNSIYSVDAGKNYIIINRYSSEGSSYYGRTKQPLSDLKLTPGKTYTLKAKITDFSQSNLTGYIYIADSNSSIKAQSQQLDSLSIGSKLEVTFIYDPDTMKELSFYMNRGFSVSVGTYIKYSDITIL